MLLEWMERAILAECLKIVLADANFPLDTYEKDRFILMEVVPGDPVVPVIWDEYKRLLEESHPGAAIKEFERFEFYEQAKDAYLVIQTGESALYGNIILKKGVL